MVRHWRASERRTILLHLVGLQLRCNEAVPNNVPCRSLCAAHCCRYYDIIKVFQLKDFNVSMVSV